MTTHSDADDLRLSDDERMHALNVLGEHYAAGRLDVGEFYDRSEAVASARTLAAVGESFRGLPGGLPLEVVDGRLRKLPTVVEPESTASERSVPARAAEDELASLRKRGGMIESLDWVIVGITLVVFLVLQLIVEWDFAWIVWTSLIATLSIPRLLLRYTDAEEEIYEELKDTEAKARKKRLREAAERIHELERKQDPDRR